MYASASSRSRRSKNGWAARTCIAPSAAPRSRTTISRARSARRSSGRGVRVLANLRARMAVEQTLILAKPDAVARSLAGEIVARFERRGLKLRAARLVTATREVGETHY